MESDFCKSTLDLTCAREFTSNRRMALEIYCRDKKRKKSGKKEEREENVTINRVDVSTGPLKSAIAE